MNRQSRAISSVALPVAFVGLAVVAAPEARSAADASWAARWMAQRTAEGAESLSAQIADAARDGWGVSPAAPVAVATEAPVDLGAMASPASLRPAPESDHPPNQPTLQFSLIDLPPPLV